MKLITSTFVFILLVFPLSFTGISTASSFPARDTDEKPIQESIREYVSQLEGSGTIKLDKQKIIGNPVITELYKGEDYQPVWDNASNRKDLIEILDDAYFEGLTSDDYHIDFIK